MYASTQLLLLSSAVTLLMTLHATEGSSIADSASSEVQAKKELLFLAKIVAPLREIARESEEIANMVARVVAEGDVSLDVAKRQGAWDMDYGWGGGRFGKRAGSGTSISQSGKRYDSFGIAGRFGRSVENAEGH